MFSICKNKIKTMTLVVAALSCSSAAFAQSESTLRNPLIPGAAAEPPFAIPNPGQVPALGTGSVPAGVTPGTLNPPTLLPSVPTLPSNNIDVTNSNPGIPFSPSMTSAPGQLGQMLGPSIPAPPSNPGTYPGPLTAPLGSVIPSQEIPVNPQGGLPGTGGFNSSIPNTRRSGQTTQQYEYRGRPSILGQGSGAAGGVQDEVTRLGPQSGYGLPYGVPSGTKNYTRNSSIDLGGGARVKTNGQVTSNGSTVADYGLSVVRAGANSAGIAAQQATDFGQGRRNQTTIRSNNTTDFGFPFKQFIQANETPQKTGQLLAPSAVLTNF